MSSWQSYNSSGASVTLTAPEVHEGQTLVSNSSGYNILEFIGEGLFGKVAKCKNLATKETVAVKILKKDTDVVQDTEKEVSMLETISVLNPDHTNVVKFFERFEHVGHTCLVFEILDRNLYDLLRERDWKPLSLCEIQTIAKQLLVALDALKGLGILHTDIKTDNIMCVNKQDQPFRVKLIDFGLARLASEVQPGMDLQPIGYRAPEIFLGLPFTEAIDVWGIGCILAFLYIADNLFPVDCNYQMMKYMVEILGQPEDHMLRAGEHTQCYFSEEEADDGPTWRLKTPEEYEAANNVKPLEWNNFLDPLSSLDDLVNIYPKGDAAEFEDRWTFVDLIKGLLHLDGDLRISSHQALQHSFITKSHWSEHSDISAQLTTSQTMMNVCTVEVSADGANTSADSKPEQESAAGIYVRGRPSGSSDDAPATRSSDGTKASVPFDDGPSKWSSDGDPGRYSDEDPAAWFSEGEVHPCSDEEDLTAWSSDGELSMSSDDEDPAAWFSEGEVHPCFDDEDLTAWSSDGELSMSSYDEDPAAWSSDGELHPCSDDEDPAAWSSDGELHPCSDDEDPAAWSSDGELSLSSYDEDPAARSSDGAKSTDLTNAASASTSRATKMMNRIRRFFRRITATCCCCWCPTVED